MRDGQKSDRVLNQDCGIAGLNPGKVKQILPRWKYCPGIDSSPLSPKELSKKH